MLSKRMNQLWKNKSRKFRSSRKPDYRRESSSRSEHRGESSEHRRSGKKEVVCYECKEPGHYKNECPKLQKDRPKRSGDRKKKVLMATWDDSKCFDSDYISRPNVFCISLTPYCSRVFAFSTTSSMVPTLKNAFSGYSSISPSMIILNPRIVSLSGTYFPGIPVKFSATWNG